MVAAPPMFCRTCSQPLDVAGDYDKDGLMVHVVHKHPPWYEADHDPDPALIVDYAGILAHCDFCLTDVQDGGWTYPAQDFMVMVEFRPGRMTDYGSSGDWCACDDCHQDIETGRWDDMMRRSATWRQTHDLLKPEAEMFVKNLWQGFRNNRTGPAYHEQRAKGRSK